MSEANTGWCDECHRHKHVCVCDPPIHIYVVEYKLVVDSGLHHSWCEGKVRCVAYDPYHAMSKLQHWITTAEFVWLKDRDRDRDKDNYLVEEYTLPKGERDLTINSVNLYAEDIGEMLKACPLPDVFEHSE